MRWLAALLALTVFTLPTAAQSADERWPRAFANAQTSDTTTASKAEISKCVDKPAFEVCGKVLTASNLTREERARSFNARGGLYVDTGKFDDAIADFNIALALSPKFATAYNNRGFAYASKGDYARAIADYDSAIREDAKSTYSLRGDAYRLKGDSHSALADYRKALELDPKDPRPHTGIGQLAQASGDTATARAAYAAAIALEPNVAYTSQRSAIATAKARIAQIDAKPVAQSAPSAAPAKPGAPDAAASQQVAANSQDASAPAKPSKPPALHLRRVALVIGNASYQVSPLANPGNDASAIAAALTSMGFDKVLLKLDLTHEGFRTSLSEIAREAATADIAMVFYAGHGTEKDGRNFLIPVDAKLDRASDLDLQAIPLDVLLSQIDGAKLLKLVVLDACRNNVFALAGARRTTTRGLARVEPQDDNTLIAYAAKEGTTADDGSGSNSPFTAALLQHMPTPGLDVQLMFRRVRDQVQKQTNGQQRPQQYADLGSGEVYLLPPQQ